MDNNVKNVVNDEMLDTMLSSHAVWLSNHENPIVPFNLENSELVGARINDENLTGAKFINSYLKDVTLI